MNVSKKINEHNNQINKIFNLIKLKNWNSLKKIIQNDKDSTNYNIKDSSNVYLIEYLVLFNQIDIIELLLKKNIRIDIIDENDQTLLYNIIKFSYIDILKLFVRKNNEIIGKNILEMKDKNGDIALFYAIKRGNKECISIILDNTRNFTIKNIKGYTAIQICIENSDFDIFKLVVDNYKNINLCNSKGLNILQLIVKNIKPKMLEYILLKFKNDINLNHTENNYNYSVLHYLFIINDLELIEIFFKNIDVKNLDVNIQDTSGNTFYHYYLYNINKNALKIYDIICDLPIKYNLFNVDGDTPCHIIVTYLNKFINYEIIVKNTIDNTNINIQNNIGNSILFLIVKENKWKDMFELLKNKKLNIFTLNHKNQTMFDYINNIDEFINLLTESYLIQLKRPSNNIWSDYWDKKCYNNNLKLDDDDEKKIKDINKKFIDNEYFKINHNNICYKIVYSKLFAYSKEFIKSKNIYKKYSYPTNTEIIKLIPTYLNIITSTYKGSTLDVFCGLLYLNNKFNQNNVIVNTSLKLLDLSSNIINCNTMSLNNNKKICEIFGFEITWKNYNLYIPSTKQNDLSRILINMKFNKIRYLLVPIGIEINTSKTILDHANFLIFDTNNNEVERFEPHGSESPYELNTDLFDETLEKKLKFLNFKYISTKVFLPKNGFQKKEIYELDKNYNGDPNGFCALWCVWWCDMRISYPQYSREELYNLLNKEIINENYSYRKIIRNYGYYITNIRDVFFKKLDVNINDWMNDNLDKKNIDKLSNLLIKKLLKIT